MVCYGISGVVNSVSLWLGLRNFCFLTLLAGKKPSNMIAGWDFSFLKVFLASSEERVFFSQES